MTKTTEQILDRESDLMKDLLDNGDKNGQAKAENDWANKKWLSFEQVQKVVIKHKGHGDCIDKIIKELKLSEKVTDVYNPKTGESFRKPEPRIIKIPDKVMNELVKDKEFVKIQNQNRKEIGLKPIKKHHNPASGGDEHLDNHNYYDW